MMSIQTKTLYFAETDQYSLVLGKIVTEYKYMSHDIYLYLGPNIRTLDPIIFYKATEKHIKAKEIQLFRLVDMYVKCLKYTYPGPPKRVWGERRDPPWARAVIPRGPDFTVKKNNI